MAGDGRDVHQATLAGLDHLATKALRGDEVAGEVDVEHLLPVAQRQVLHSGKAQDAGGVDEDVDAAEVGDGGVDSSLNLGLVGGVHLVALGVDAKLGSEVGGSGLDLLLVQVEHDDVGAIAANSRQISAPIPPSAPVTAQTSPSSLSQLLIGTSLLVPPGGSLPLTDPRGFRWLSYALHLRR